MTLVPTRSRPAKAKTSRQESLLTALVMICAGTGLVVGVGIGLRWLRVDVLTGKMVIGMLALGVGLALFVWGLGRIGRQRPSWSRWLMRCLLGLLVVLVVWILSPALIATNVPPIGHTSTPVEFGLSAQEVWFVDGDGTELFGWYVPPTQGKVAVLRHGSGTTASQVLPHARVLVDNGYGVLATDARGHGLSEGTGMDFGWSGDQDIVAAVDFLIGQPEVDPESIVVVGLSMGGEEAIGAIGSDPRIAAAVAEGIFARTDEDKIWMTAVYGWRGRVQVGLEWVQYAITAVLTDAPRPVSLAESAETAAPRPILIITAGHRPDETEAARQISRSSEDVSIWEVPGAEHVGGLTTARTKWEETVIGFLDEGLAASNG